MGNRGFKGVLQSLFGRRDEMDGEWYDKDGSVSSHDEEELTSAKPAARREDDAAKEAETSKDEPPYADAASAEDRDEDQDEDWVEGSQTSGLDEAEFAAGIDVATIIGDATPEDVEARLAELQRRFPTTVMIPNWTNSDAPPQFWRPSTGAMMTESEVDAERN